MSHGRKTLKILTLSALFVTVSSSALGQVTQINAQPLPTAANATTTDIKARFQPRPSSEVRLDYDAWDSLLENMVFYTNISTRTRAPSPKANIGSNLIFGHTSPYRLEGNRIPFSDLSDEYLNFLSAYRQELEEISETIDVTTLSRNEQLSFWLNLHNVVIIEQIALAYPVKIPTKIKIGKNKTPLHDAKVISVDGTKLSLRDIREKIVYQHWENPLVIYGFFLGNIGSPTIQNYAFNGKNVKTILTRSAEEFTNSLRGFTRGWVSEIYYDLQPYYFKDFETDLRQHLKEYMFDDVKEELDQSKKLKKARYELIVADLSGGDSSTNTNFLDDRGRSSKITMIAKIIEKRHLLRRKGIQQNGTVIIEDIPTIDNTYSEENVVN